MKARFKETEAIRRSKKFDPDIKKVSKNLALIRKAKSQDCVSFLLFLNKYYIPMDKKVYLTADMLSNAEKVK